MKRPRILKDLSIDEVSGCDSGANPLAKIVLMKRDSQEPTTMTNENLISAALAGKLSKAQVDAVLRANAEARRAVGESESVAFTKFITGDPVGQRLYAAFRKADGPELHQEKILKALAKKNPSETAADKDGAATDANKVFTSMVNETMTKDRCTRSAAIDSLLKTPHGLASFRAAKQQDRDRSAAANAF